MLTHTAIILLCTFFENFGSVIWEAGWPRWLRRRNECKGWVVPTLLRELVLFYHLQLLKYSRMIVLVDTILLSTLQLTLTSLTSEKACQVWGGLREPPPLLSWLWSKFLLKNHVFLKAGINFNSFGPFLEIFLKNLQKLKIHQKMAKYERNF